MGFSSMEFAIFSMTHAEKRSVGQPRQTRVTLVIFDRCAGRNIFDILTLRNVLKEKLTDGGTEGDKCTLARTLGHT